MAGFDDTRTVGALRGLLASHRPYVEYFVNVLRYYGLPVIIIEGYRSPGRQYQLYLEGKTQRATGGMHTARRAFDIWFEGMSADEIPQEWWDFAGVIGERIGFTWGGRWSFRDYGHFEA